MKFQVGDKVQTNEIMKPLSGKKGITGTIIKTKQWEDNNCGYKQTGILCFVQTVKNGVYSFDESRLEKM